MTMEYELHMIGINDPFLASIQKQWLDVSIDPTRCPFCREDNVVERGALVYGKPLTEGLKSFGALICEECWTQDRDTLMALIQDLADFVAQASLQ
jgi:hypothetical protein